MPSRKTPADLCVSSIELIGLLQRQRRKSLLLDKAVKGTSTSLGFVSSRFQRAAPRNKPTFLPSTALKNFSLNKPALRSRNQQLMRNTYCRILRDIRFKLSDMEHHMYKILNRFRPGFGLLRSFRGTLPARVPRDIESAQPELTQPQTQDDTPATIENAVLPLNTTQLVANHGNQTKLSPAKSISANNNAGDEEPLQPQFTEGPSRFVIAKDGSKDCVALLVNEEFLARLRDLFQANRDISALDGPLYHADMDAKDIECSVRKAQESLDTAESAEQTEECQTFIEQRTSELLKLNHRKGELEKERSLVEGRLELSKSHTQWVLETAMREADYLGPERPLPAVLLRDEDAEYAEDNVEASEHGTPVQSPAVSIASDHEEAEVSEEEIQRRAAYDEFIDRSQLLDTIKADFDDQQNNYRENLAMFEQKLEAGTNTMSRSAFDRRSVQYGQQLTRALIDAEEAFEEARDHALALHAITSDHDHEFYYGAPQYEESWPENKIADYNASQDWTFVESWMDDVPDSNSHSQAVSVEEEEVDEWDAEEVEVNDSISMIDCEEYRRDIDRYRRICARLEDPCPEARWLGQPDGRVLERRGSCWM